MTLSHTPESRQQILEVFDNQFPQRRSYVIETICQVHFVCPKTGQPDFGELEFRYIADKKCVELKSLKFYLQSYRNDGIFMKCHQHDRE